MDVALQLVVQAGVCLQFEKIGALADHCRGLMAPPADIRPEQVDEQARCQIVDEVQALGLQRLDDRLQAVMLQTRLQPRPELLFQPFQLAAGFDLGAEIEQVLEQLASIVVEIALIVAPKNQAPGVTVLYVEPAAVG